MKALAIYLRDLRSRVLTVSVVVAVLVGFLAVGLAMFESMDTTIYDTLPESMRSLMGIPAGATSAVRAFETMLGVMGALTVAGVSVAFGSGLVAAEEQARILPLLLANPVGRAPVAAAKLLVLFSAVGLIGAGLWAGAHLSALLLSTSTVGTHLGAYLLSITLNALVAGVAAFSVGAGTGSRSAAAAAGGLLIVFGWLMASLLPLWSVTEGMARLVPWYWYSAPQTLMRGLSWGYLSAQLLTIAIIGALGIVAFTRRDLLGSRSGTWQRIRGLPLWGSLPSPQTRTLLGVTFTRTVNLLVVTSLIMFLVMGVMIGMIYRPISAELTQMVASLPPEFLEVWDAADLASPAGFYWGETMGMIAPAAVVVVGAALAANFGTEEKTGRAGLLLGMPVGRFRYLTAYTVAIAGQVAVVSVATGGGIWAGSQLGGMGLVPVHIWGATLQLFALGFLMGSVALLLAATTGSAALAGWGTALVAIAAYFVNVLFKMTPDHSDWARLSPFHYYSANQPLANGASWESIAILVGIAILLILVSYPAYSRRDLRA